MLNEIVNFLFPRYNGPERRQNNPDEHRGLERRGTRYIIVQIVVYSTLLGAIATAAYINNEYQKYEKSKLQQSEIALPSSQP
ncbi:hypothetical protein KY330_05945 [Candidatus Woesearchaeota archaeon]|nr:hypothetical protein [Candidatus Woesearchaeota archaeon]